MDTLERQRYDHGKAYRGDCHSAGCTMSRWDPLLEEALAASVAMVLLGSLVALLFWLSTGLSPWPMVVLAEVAGFGIGTVVLTLTSPRRRR